jgi:hypothetical protein
MHQQESPTAGDGRDSSKHFDGFEAIKAEPLDFSEWLSHRVSPRIRITLGLIL